MIKANSFYKFTTYFLTAVLVLIVTQSNFTATAATKKKTLTCVAVTGGYEGDLATYLNNEVLECVTKLENKGYVVVDIIDLSARGDFLVRAQK